MKILCVTHSYGPDGASVMLINTLSHWIKKLGWQVDALVKPETHKTYEATILAIGMNMVGFTQVDCAAYDFVLINTFCDIEFVGSFYQKIPVVLWVHEGENMLISAKMAPDGQQKMQHWAQLLAKVDLAIFQTQWQVDSVFCDLLRNVPRERIAIVPNGVPDVGVLPLVHHHVHSPIRIVNVSTVFGRKRQLDLAKAVINIAKYYSITCEFIGDLSYAQMLGDEVTHYLNDYPHILKWSGAMPREEVLARVAQADIFCFPSIDESFPLAPLEAALLNIPVVMANLGPYPGIGWVSGKNCLIHTKRDVASLQTCILQLIADPLLYQRIAQGGRTLAQPLSFKGFLKHITAAVLSLPNRSNNKNAHFIEVDA